MRVHAFPIHIGDLIGIQGPYPSQTAYLAPGIEATGIVEAVGPDTPVATGITIGARASFFPHPGAWSAAGTGRAPMCSRISSFHVG